MRNALVIGGGGFIGTHLVRYLCSVGWRVHVLDRAPSDEFRQISSPLVTCTEMDLHDDPELTAKVRKSAVVFHLAAQPSVEICEQAPIQSTRDNFLTSVKIVNALERVGGDRNVRTLVFTSTSAVYGDPQTHSPISEDAQTVPVSNYGKDKLRSEQVLLSPASRSERPFRCCVLRLFNIYGPGQNRKSPYSGVITRFLEACQTEEPLQIHGSGEQVRDFIHVNDLVRALYLAAQSPGFETPLNVASGIGTSVNRLAEFFAHDKHLGVNRLGPRANDIFFSVGDPSKIRSVLSWSPSVRFELGIKNLITETEKHPCEL